MSLRIKWGQCRCRSCTYPELYISAVDGSCVDAQVEEEEVSTRRMMRKAAAATGLFKAELIAVVLMKWPDHA